MQLMYVGFKWASCVHVLNVRMV